MTKPGDFIKLKTPQGLKRDWTKVQTSLASRVKFVNALRSIVGRRMPKNKAGTPLVSDFDLIDAIISERAEAIEAAINQAKND